MQTPFFLFSPKDIFLHCFWRERKGERETLTGERSIRWLPPVHTQDHRPQPLPGIICIWTGGRTPPHLDQESNRNLDMCPDQESNPQPFVYAWDYIPTNRATLARAHANNLNTYFCPPTQGNLRCFPHTSSLT